MLQKRSRSRKGVIRDASIKTEFLKKLRYSATGDGWIEVIFETEARPSGTDGNKEFFLPGDRIRIKLLINQILDQMPSCLFSTGKF